MKQTDIPAQVAIESRALEIAQRLDDELLGATLPQSAAYESLTRLLEGAADTLRELVVFRRAAPPSGDRSLLRAPTPSEFMKARARQLVMIARENAWTDEQLAGQILDEVYAVDGLRGTAPDRYPHGEGCPAILSRTGKCDCELIVSRPDVGTEDRALREALEPFAKFAEIVKLETRPDLMDTERFVCSFCWGTDENGEHRGEATFTYGDLRRAARVLRESVEGEQRT